MRLLKVTVESILLYRSDSWSLTKSLEKKFNGTYTRMPRKEQNISVKDKVINNFLYSSNPRLTEIIWQKWLSLAGHVSRPNEPAGRVLLWEPDEWRRVGHPKITLKKTLEDDTGLEAHEFQTVMLDWVSLSEEEFCHVDSWRCIIIAFVVTVNIYMMIWELTFIFSSSKKCRLLVFRSWVPGS